MLRQRFHTTAEYLFQTVLVLLLGLSATALLRAQGTAGEFPVGGNSSMYEIHRIDFVGNSYFPDETLLGVIGTRASEVSATHSLVRFYRQQLERIPGAPSLYIEQMQKIEREIGDIQEYYNRDLVAADTMALISYYREHGFHLATVTIAFTYQQETKENVLTYRIIENPPARLEELTYIGLDNLPAEIETKLQEVRTVRMGRIFNQGDIIGQNERILQVLRNNGYFYATYKRPLVIYMPERNIDSVTIFFQPGKRQRIASYYFVDSLRGQPGIALKTREDQLEFKVGDWYDQSAMAQSERNLYALGVFDLVGIDTSSARVPHNDTSLSLRVFTRMKKVQEIGLSLLTNKNATDDFWNAGVEGTYTHKNIAGSAQTLNPYGRILIQDINGWIDRGLTLQSIQFERQAGFRYSQPYLTDVLGARMGFSFQPQYSNRTIYSPLRLESYSARLSLPVTLDSGMFINSVFLDFSLDHERPIDLAEATEKALAQPDIDSLLIYRQLYQYFKLEEIVNEKGIFPSSFIISANVVGDSRNSPFSPNRGNFFSVTGEWGGPGGIGGARFIRLLFQDFFFTPISNKDVLAFKLKLGHTFWQDRNNSYVPLDKHFFAGGSNSVRAFASRELRSVPVDASSPSQVLNLTDFIGSGSLIEGSIEYRYKFRLYPRTSSFFDQLLVDLGVTGFLDFGNTYNSFLENPNNYFSMPISVVFRKIALGTGLGLRYDTPVGPLRIDVATKVYDPMASTNQWLWERPFAVRWQFGIGHAF